MQTFVPLPNITDSANVLDKQRCWKQVVETYQILNSLSSGKGWIHHPATKMWKNHTECLKFYFNEFYTVSIEKWNIQIRAFSKMRISGEIVYPDWWGGPIHSSHRAALLFKKPDYYSQFGWAEIPEIKYFWPK